MLEELLIWVLATVERRAHTAAKVRTAVAYPRPMGVVQTLPFAPLDCHLEHLPRSGPHLAKVYGHILVSEPAQLLENPV